MFRSIFAVCVRGRQRKWVADPAAGPAGPPRAPALTRSGRRARRRPPPLTAGARGGPAELAAAGATTHFRWGHQPWSSDLKGDHRPLMHTANPPPAAPITLTSWMTNHFHGSHGATYIDASRTVQDVEVTWESLFLELLELIRDVGVIDAAGGER